MLKAAHPDTISLAMAVEQRFLSLCADWIRVKGISLVPPNDMTRDLVLWRSLVLRLRKGDFRENEDELDATRNIAQWTFDKKCELTGKQKQTIEWKN